MASYCVTSLVAFAILAGDLAAPGLAPLTAQAGARYVLAEDVLVAEPEDGLDVGSEADSLVVPVQSGNACARAAQQAQAMTGGEILSVVPARNGKPICKVTVLVVNSRGRPKRIKLRIPMDF